MSTPSLDQDRFALTVVGSGTVAPSPHRGGPAFWVDFGTSTALLDCGAGALQSATRLGLDWAGVTRVILTHFHVDHCGEIPHLLLALRYGTLPPRHAPLEIIGPAGLATWLGHLAEAYGTWVLEPGYPLQLTEIDPAAAQAIPLGSDATLDAFATLHTAESLAYRLQKGNRSLVYTGDTPFNLDLARWADRPQAFLCECSLPADLALPSHLTPAEAGQMAKIADPERLLLTHLYPPVEKGDILGEIRRSFSGRTEIVADGVTYAIGDTVHSGEHPKAP